MKTSKYLEDLRTQSADELNAQLVEAKKELFNLRFQNATNQLDNTGRRMHNPSERRSDPWKKEILEKPVSAWL